MYVFWWLYINYFRPVLKWFLRRTTGLCELQRICYGKISGATRIKSVEYSLQMSRQPQIRRLIEHLNDISRNGRFTGANEREILCGAINTVLLVKNINPKLHPQFVKNFGKCIEQIWGYQQLIAEVEGLRRIQYNSDDMEHERKLYELWDRLMPNEQLEARITKQWQYIGFQGDDPKTDFRGMGMLGLENLLFFVNEYRGPARHVLSHSNHPKYGYCFAIVGINLTSMAYNLLKNGDAKTYFYNTTKSLANLRIFHQFYSYLFYEFDKYWVASKPKNIMEFSNIKTQFENNIKLNLQDPTAVFRINISVDTV